MMIPHLSNHSKGVLLVGAAAVAWSTGGLFFRAIALDTWTTSFWRSIFAAFFLAIYALITHYRKPLAVSRENFRHGLLVALGIAASMATFLPALSMTSVANVALIYATAPILTAVLAYFWLREQLDGVTIVCAFAVVLGATILLWSSGQGQGIGGDLLAFASTAALVLVALAIRARPGYSLLPYVCLANIFVAAVAFPLAPSLAISWHDGVLLALFAFVQVAFSFTLFTIGARMLPAKETALINALEGPLSPFWVWLAFGEYLSPTTMTSGAIIMSAVFAYIVISARQQERTGSDYARPRTQLTLQEQ
jgi:drug/metabolite transporter (DMT)-like permease